LCTDKSDDPKKEAHLRTFPKFVKKKSYIK